MQGRGKERELLAFRTEYRMKLRFEDILRRHLLFWS